jgi:hypothetical protein
MKTLIVVSVPLVFYDRLIVESEKKVIEVNDVWIARASA